ncbi:hypothetical protein A8U91_04112 [Halomonas elongata]|uniref:Uncharacterized protein n=1 Tax=Halomonas elongata TaxID=2746 RepID=A0A1B8NYH5_HALEL|nr:hypothetical protein A8U91_04112 [Halomonas elongata]
MTLENVPLIRTHKINGGKAYPPDKLAKLFQREKIECPTRYGVMDVALQRRVFRHLVGKRPGPREPSANTPRVPVAVLHKKRRLLRGCLTM